MSELKKVKQEIPEWFNGAILTEDEVITNQISGDNIELNPLEVAIYDITMGANQIAYSLDKKYLESMKDSDHNPKADYFWDLVKKGCSWFRENNAKAYMVLLD